MSYHQDWLMRQIEAITTMLGYILLGKNISVLQIEVEDHSVSGENELYLELAAMVRKGQICQAENALYEALEAPGAQVLDAARRFYSDLNQLSDEELHRCDFSREEIMSGLEHVCNVFGIPL